MVQLLFAGTDNCLKSRAGTEGAKMDGHVEERVRAARVVKLALLEDFGIHAVRGPSIRRLHDAWVDVKPFPVLFRNDCGTLRIVRVISWNVNAIRGIGPRLRGVIGALASQEPDIVLLQEVGRDLGLVQKFKDGLATIGLKCFFHSGALDGNRKKYGNVIASRWSVTPHEPGWAPGAPWPQLLARATVNADGTDIDVISAHMPNGSGNGWKKIETFEALAGYLQDAEDMPRILGGDFNEPRRFDAAGLAISFGAREQPDGTDCTTGAWKRLGEGHPRKRWDDGVNSVLGSAAGHGLRHAFLELNPGIQEITHLTRQGERFFDHLLVSKHFEIEAAGYRHEWRLPGAGAMSDHSAAWATLEVR